MQKGLNSWWNEAREHHTGQKQNGDESDYGELQTEEVREQLSSWLAGTMHVERLGLSARRHLLIHWARESSKCPQAQTGVDSETEEMGPFIVCGS